MYLKWFLAASTALAVIANVTVWTRPARAQVDETEMLGFFQLCDHGDRKSCIRFGMILGENRARQAEWRSHHPEWFWWEK